MKYFYTFKTHAMKIRWIEFFLITCVYLFLLIVGLRNMQSENTQIGFQLHLLTVYFIVSLYLLYVYPKLFSVQRMHRWLVSMGVIFFMESLGHYMIFKWYPFPAHQMIPPFALSGMVILGLLIYSAVKAFVSYLYTSAAFTSVTWHEKVLKGLLISLAFGVLLFLSIFFVNPYIGALTAWSIPFCYTLFAVHQYYLLPYLSKYGNPIIIRIVLSVLCNLVCIALFSSLMEMTIKLSDQHFVSFDGFNVLFCFLLGVVITPIVYLFFHYQNKYESQVVGLEQKLGRTSADLQLLQSQINPHFLFNIMNTLYSMALTENADRTAMSIQKLSGMMRFMLHENQQDSILLIREIHYIQEYIEIQKLRIADLPSIEIRIDLPEEVNQELYIAPMLLIPFIENAFKHGISLNYPSWIRIQLHIDQSKLKLSVYNSIHVYDDVDPEKDKSGIGLTNVLKRLQLIYPDRHKVSFEQTNTEYFIFLTIELNNIS